MDTNHQRKKILVFIDWFLPGFKAGGPVRSMANMVDHLSGHFDFYIVTRNTEYQESTPYTAIDSNCWVDFQPGVKVFYTSASLEGIALWRQLIHEGGFQTVYINGIYSFKYSILPLLAAKRQKVPHIIVSPRGMLAQSAIGVKRQKKNLFLRFARLFKLYKGVRWHATNEKEANEIRHLAGDTVTISTAPNLARKGNVDFQSVDKKEGVLRLCSFARISPEKNTLYAIQCLQNINTDVTVSLDLYGQIYNQDYWGECAKAIEELPSHVIVTHKGVVDAEMVGPMMTQYHALLLPSRGENFGHVILESLMNGRPVIISDQTPWRYMQEKQAGWDNALADLTAFTEVINSLAGMSQEEFDIYCKGAHQLACEFVNDETLLIAYEKMFHKI